MHSSARRLGAGPFTWIKGVRASSARCGLREVLERQSSAAFSLRTGLPQRGASGEEPTDVELSFAPRASLGCRSDSGRGLPHSKTLARSTHRARSARSWSARGLPPLCVRRRYVRAVSVLRPHRCARKRWLRCAAPPHSKTLARSTHRAGSARSWTARGLPPLCVRRRYVRAASMLRPHRCARKWWLRSAAPPQSKTLARSTVGSRRCADAPHPPVRFAWSPRRRRLPPPSQSTASSARSPRCRCLPVRSP